MAPCYRFSPCTCNDTISPVHQQIARTYLMSGLCQTGFSRMSLSPRNGLFKCKWRSWAYLQPTIPVGPNRKTINWLWPTCRFSSALCPSTCTLLKPTSPAWSGEDHVGEVFVFTPGDPIRKSSAKKMNKRRKNCDGELRMLCMNWELRMLCVNWECYVLRMYVLVLKSNIASHRSSSGKLK